MKSFSEDTKLARNNLHFREAEDVSRVSGFVKSLDHKNQVKRDYRKREQNALDLIRKNLDEE